MTVESYACQTLSNNYCRQFKTKRFHMAMSRTTIKQNGHSNINENRTDDDYDGSGKNNNNNIQMSS